MKLRPSHTRITERTCWSADYLDFAVQIECPQRVGYRVRRAIIKALRAEFRREQLAEQRRIEANARLQARERAAIRRIRGVHLTARRARR